MNDRPEIAIIGLGYVGFPLAAAFGARVVIIGVSHEFAEWRLNLRGSDTAPALRRNVETRTDKVLLARKVGQIRRLIETSHP